MEHKNPGRKPYNLCRGSVPVCFIDLFYFMISDFPVISLGCSIPIISISVGAISARQPPSLSL